MDGDTAEVRYQRWAQIFQDRGNSGLSKREYCREKGIDEKQFYYYQRRIRSLIAAQAEQPLLPEGNLGMASVTSTAGRPQIVKLPSIGMTSGKGTMIRFRVNGMDLSVSEDIPTPFLTKLLEAASHGSR